MKLTAEEQSILNGDSGKVLQKIMRSVVVYGETFDAEKLVPLSGHPHSAMSVGANVLKPYFNMLDTIIDEHLTTFSTFTVDPRPMDTNVLNYSILEKLIFRFMYGYQEKYEKKLDRLGLIDNDSFTCACYLPEVGNIPSMGEYLAWSESSAVVFANSALGARTNRNSVGIDMLCNIVGKAPYFGFLTDGGRQAAWNIHVATSRLPNPQVLGSAIGMKVVEEVPFITGLKQHLDGMNETAIRDYLKELGAAAASNGAVGLFHVEGITPEAAQQGDHLLKKQHGEYIISDKELDRVYRSYPVLWKDKNSSPELCFMGCPHFSLSQLYWWTENIGNQLARNNRDQVSIETVICAPPAVMVKFMEDEKTWERFNSIGLKVCGICPMAHMTNPVCSRKSVITNSNKLRTYSTARFYTDEELLEIICQ